MRVLDTTTFELISGEQEIFKQDGYAILSHRWVGQEITFDQLADHIDDLKRAPEKSLFTPQLAKIRGACDRAREQGIRWMWIDTCCINKASTVEETESINSMFRWYRDAKVCITYLFDVDARTASRAKPYDQATNSKEKMKRSVFQSIHGDGPSEWFSRGWTLQELLAPHTMQFYDTNWIFIGTKNDLSIELERITGIEAAYLTGEKHFRKACIATKLSWQAGRTTAREEDIAYSMLGIFNIIMTPQYGEGSRAFMRLQHALLTSTTDESLFAWHMPHPSAGDKYDIEHNAQVHWARDEWGLLAPTPAWFRGCEKFRIEGDGVTKIERSGKGFQMTRQGVQVSFPLAKGYGKYRALIFLSGFAFCFAPLCWVAVARKVKRRVEEQGVPFVLNCWTENQSGQLAAVQICLQPVALKTFSQGNEAKLLKRMRCSEMMTTMDYHTRAASDTEGFVVQPELNFGD